MVRVDPARRTKTAGAGQLPPRSVPMLALGDWVAAPSGLSHLGSRAGQYGRRVDRRRPSWGADEPTRSDGSRNAASSGIAVGFAVCNAWHYSLAPPQLQRRRCHIRPRNGRINGRFYRMLQSGFDNNSWPLNCGRRQASGPSRTEGAAARFLRSAILDTPRYAPSGASRWTDELTSAVIYDCLLRTTRVRR